MRVHSRFPPFAVSPSALCPPSSAMKALRILAPVLIGAILGALMGYFGQCTSGTCPLTSTWWRGALYGGGLGLLAALSGRHG